MPCVTTMSLALEPQLYRHVGSTGSATRHGLGLGSTSDVLRPQLDLLNVLNMPYPSYSDV